MTPCGCDASTAGAWALDVSHFAGKYEWILGSAVADGRGSTAVVCVVHM